MFLANLSLDVCIPRSQNSFHSTVLSGSTHLGQKTSGGSGLRIYAGAKIYYRSDLLLQAETLVTVSPCEFPPRCSPRLLLRHPRVGEDPLSSCRGSPFLSPCHPGPSYLSSPTWSGISPLSPHFMVLHLAFPKILYRLHTNNLLKKFRHEKAFP